VKFSAAADAYLRTLRDIKPATRTAYEGYVRQVIAHLGDVWIDTLTGQVLDGYAGAEIARLGRAHTVVKRFEAIIKPTLRHAVEIGTLHRLPVFPRLRSDYRKAGARTFALTQEQYAVLRLELPEMSIVNRGDGTRIVAYPRLWLDLAVTTGMHESDLDRFAGADYDDSRRLWLRRNSKGDAHYEPEWLPCDPYMDEVLCAHLRKRKLAPNRLFVAELDAGRDDELPAQWMRRRLMWAAHRIGLCVVKMERYGATARPGKREPRQPRVVS